MIELEPARALLATPRPAPGSRKADPRIWALYRAMAATSDPVIAAECDAEIEAMYAEKAAYWEARRGVVNAEARSMETCEMRPRDHGPGTCDACGAPLPGKRRRWCSDECADRWWGNHTWSWARSLAIRLAGGHEAPCATCGRIVGYRGEVNHRDPREGRGYGPGCHNHQDNLEVLCHDCHAAETTRQRRSRIPPRPARRPVGDPPSSFGFGE